MTETQTFDTVAPHIARDLAAAETGDEIFVNERKTDLRVLSAHDRPNGAVALNCTSNGYDYVVEVLEDEAEVCLTRMGSTRSTTARIRVETIGVVPEDVPSAEELLADDDEDEDDTEDDAPAFVEGEVVETTDDDGETYTAVVVSATDADDLPGDEAVYHLEFDGERPAFGSHHDTDLFVESCGAAYCVADVLERAGQTEADGGDRLVADGGERPEACECSPETDTEDLDPRDAERVEGESEPCPCWPCARAGFETPNPSPPVREPDRERPDMCNCADLVTGDGPCARCAADGFETRADAAPREVRADGSGEPQFAEGDRLRDTSVDRADDAGDSDAMRVVESPLMLEDEGEDGEAHEYPAVAGDYTAGGRPLLSYEGNEDADESDYVVRVVFESWLDANVPEWRTRPDEVAYALDEFTATSLGSPQTYDYPESRLERIEDEADEVDA